MGKHWKRVAFLETRCVQETHRTKLIGGMEMVSPQPLLLTAVAIIGSAIVLSRVLGCVETEGKSEKKKPRAPLVKYTKRDRNIPFVEICVSDYESAKESFHGGASSLEVCSNRSEGGITPSMGLIEQCVELVKGTDVEIHVLVRPRPGDFIYSDAEFEIMQRDIIAAKVAGADGIVCGILTKQGNVDIERMAVLRKISHGMSLTFHRAFDMCGDVDAALDSILSCSCDRLLTSGQETAVLQGVENGTLQRIMKRAEGSLTVVAAAGVTADNVSRIIQKSSVIAVHAGSAVTAWTSFQPSTLGDAVEVSKGNTCDAPEMMSYMCADSDKVRNLVVAAEKMWTELKILQRRDSWSDSD